MNSPVPLLPELQGQTFTTRGEAQTLRLGGRTARGLAPGDVVLLQGDLGAGKTVFVRGVCRALGCDPRDVRSPSFTLVNVYEGRVKVNHVDLYRLETVEDVEGIGLEEVFSPEAVALVEWAERLGAVPEGAIAVQFRHAGGNEREIRFLAGEDGRQD